MRELYSVQEKKRGGKRWRTSHIHGRGECAPKTIAKKFRTSMKKNFGDEFIYRIKKCELIKPTFRSTTKVGKKKSYRRIGGKLVQI